ncbi:MAG: biotin/lipoyl-containing protein [Bacillota bacterium]
MIRKFIVTINNEEYEVLVEEVLDGEIQTTKTVEIQNNQPATSVKKIAQPPMEPVTQQKQEMPTNSGGHKVVAPLPGVVLKILAQQGEKVSLGQTLLILEAMKMENEINSPVAGVVSAIFVNPNQNVNTNDILITIE